jgi:hypothetical protein
MFQVLLDPVTAFQTPERAMSTPFKVLKREGIDGEPRAPFDLLPAEMLPPVRLCKYATPVTLMAIETSSTFAPHPSHDHSHVSASQERGRFSTPTELAPLSGMLDEPVGSPPLPQWAGSQPPSVDQGQDERAPTSPHRLLHGLDRGGAANLARTGGDAVAALRQTAGTRRERLTVGRKQGRGDRLGGSSRPGHPPHSHFSPARKKGLMAVCTAAHRPPPVVASIHDFPLPPVSPVA